MVTTTSLFLPRRTRLRRAAIRIAALAPLVAFPACAGANEVGGPSTGPAGTEAPAPEAVVVLENERVQVRRLEVAPGQSTGRRPGGVDQLTVFVKGGVLTSTATHRAVLWRDGRVAWSDAHDPPDAGSINTGDAPVVLIVVTLKPRPLSGVGGSPSATSQRPISYPNVPGEDLLENDRLIVQRFSLQPGQWEGPHGHLPNSLWVFIRGGKGASRSRLEAAHRYPRPFADGEVGWMDPIDPSVEHESGNVDDHPSDWLWILLKD